MYRGIRYIDEGDHVEYKHFQTINEAYTWLYPSPVVQQIQRWHIKELWAVKEETREIKSLYLVGFNQLEPPTTLYIQHVHAITEPLPELGKKN